jgi:hypothetical protein
MCYLDIRLSNIQIALDHFQGGMTQDTLQRINISMIAQVIDREGMAKTVNRDIDYPSSFPDDLDNIQETVNRKRPAGVVDVDGFTRTSSGRVVRKRQMALAVVDEMGIERCLAPFPQTLRRKFFKSSW